MDITGLDAALSTVSAYDIGSSTSHVTLQEAEDVEDVAVRAVMLEKLNEALHTLTDEETAIIHALFYQEISEVELAKKLGIARTTLQSRKYKILEKLRKLL